MHGDYAAYCIECIEATSAYVRSVIIDRSVAQFVWELTRDSGKEKERPKSRAP